MISSQGSRVEPPSLEKEEFFCTSKKALKNRHPVLREHRREWETLSGLGESRAGSLEEVALEPSLKGGGLLQ